MINCTVRRSPSLPDVVQCTVTGSEDAFLGGLSHDERCCVRELDEVWQIIVAVQSPLMRLGIY